MKLKEWLQARQGALSVQTARQPVGFWEQNTPLFTRDCAVYDGLRQAIPLIDAALDKIERLVGDCRPVCSNRAAQAELEQFFQQVPVGAVSQGMEAFLRGYLDSLLTYGTAVGEVVLTEDGKSVAGLYQAPLDAVTVRRGQNPMQREICALKNGLTPVPVPFPQLILYTALNPKPGQLWGTSLLAGLPFVSEVLQKIYASIGQNFERIANLRYAVTYRPGGNPVDRACAREIAGNIAREWADAMNAQKQGQIRDFVAVGDVDIKVIGADNQMIDTEVPVRQMLEQMVAKLGIPPFLLGLQWSTTERMSAQQSDILTSELESYRRLLTPVLLQVCTIYLRTRGYSCQPEICWEEINLQDAVELANARLTGLQADQLQRQLEKKEEG